MFSQTTAPTTAPSSLEMHEWVVLVCSPFQSLANPDGIVLSTLPAMTESQRKSAPADEKTDPQPVGVIRFTGHSPTPVDVSVALHGSKVMVAWPIAKARSNHVLWENLAISNELPTTSSMEEQASQAPLEPADWMNDLRKEPSSWVRCGNTEERFLLYDYALDYTSPLKIAGGGKLTYELDDRTSDPLHHLTLYKPSVGGWSEAQIDQLGGQPAASRPATQPATQSTSLTLTAAAATQPTDLFAPWKQRLMVEGISDSDTDVIVRILAKHALDPKRLTAVYELDAAEMDRLLPLEVLPEPKKMTRVGLVIVRDADPGVASEIDELAAQLGDDDWSKRDAAYKALAKLGKAAKPQLEKAAKSKDMEVVWRAERLLAEMNGTPTPADQ